MKIEVKRPHLWLFAVPLFIPLSVFGSRWFSSVEVNIGRYAAESQGERAALDRLQLEANTHPEAASIEISWRVVGDDPDYQPGHLLYNRRNHWVEFAQPGGGDDYPRLHSVTEADLWRLQLRSDGTARLSATSELLSLR